MKKTFTIKLFILTVLLFIIAGTGWQFSRAQTETPFGGNPGDDNYSPTEQGLTETGSSDPNDYDFNDYDQGGGLTEGNQQGELEKARKEAEKKCEEEAGLGSMAEKAGSLANMLSQGWEQQLPQTLTDFVKDTLPGLAQEHLKAVLPNLIKTSLGNKLPSYVNNAISDMVRAGISPTSANITEAINRGVDSIVTGTIKQEVPNAINGAIKDKLPGFLNSRFGSQAAEIINGNQDLINRVKDAVNQAVLATQQAQKQAGQDTTASAQLLGGSVNLSSLSDPNLTDAQRQELTQNILNGMSSSAVESLANDSNIVDLGKSFAPIITQQILPQISQQFSSGFGSISADAGFSGTVGSTVSGLFGSGFDMSGGISGSFFNPIVNASLGPIGNSTYSAVAGAINPNYVSTADMMQGAYGYQDSLRAAAGQTQGDVAASGGKISQGAFSSQGLAGLGNSLKGSLAGAMGGMVGDLVGNIPVVGGLLGPIAQQMVTQAMLALMGLPADFLGFPVADIGLGFNVSQGFKGQGKITNEVVKNSAKSNENEKHLNETQDKAKTLTAQICVYNQMHTTEQKSLVDEVYKHGPDARNAAYNAALEARNANNKYLATSQDVSSGVTKVPDNANGENGQPAVGNVAQNIKGGMEEATNKVQTLATSNNSGNFQGNAVVAAHQQITGASFQQRFKSNTTEEQFKSLSDPAKLEKMTSDEFWNLRKAAIFDDFDSSWLVYDNEIATQAGKAKELALAQYIANQGWNDIRECALWNDAPAPGDLSGGIPDGLGGLRYCWDWVVLTPGSSVKALADKLNNLPYDFAASTQNVRGDSIVSTLDKPLRRATNMTVAPTQAETQTGSDPCPGTDPCPNTGWKPNQISSLANGLVVATNNLAQNASEVFNFGNYGGGSGSGGGNIVGSDGLDYTSLASLFENLPAATIDNFTVTKQGSGGLIATWSSNSTFYCSPGNDWQTTPTLIDPLFRLETEGQMTLSPEETPGSGNKEYSLICYDIFFQPINAVSTVQ